MVGQQRVDRSGWGWPVWLEHRGEGEAGRRKGPRDHRGDQESPTGPYRPLVRTVVFSLGEMGYH